MITIEVLKELEEIKERLIKAIDQKEELIKSLPKGSIQKQKNYYHLTYREDGKVQCKYVASELVESTLTQIEERKKKVIENKIHKKELDILNKTIVKIEKLHGIDQSDNNREV